MSNLAWHSIINLMDNTKETPQPAQSLTLQQEALAYAMLHRRDDVLTGYTQDTKGNRYHGFTFNTHNFAELSDQFRSDPKGCLAHARENLFAINRDPRLTPDQRQDRLRRYVDAYLDLIVKLDRSAFPPTPPGQVYRSVPEYIPDGLTDMGGDPTMDPRARNREKIRVDKAKVFNQSRQLFYEIFSIGPSNANSDQMKMYIAQKVAHFVYTQMPYDYKDEAFQDPLKSVPISAYSERRLAQCRHHALYTQTLLQAFGITSRLMKSDASFREGEPLGPHGNNLVRINNKWFLLDTTNPEILTGRGQIFIKPIPERDIDLNNRNYTWRLTSGNQTRTYQSRNNMYWKIEDNVRNPV